MADAGVTGIVTADVLEQFSDDVVLTTAWVDGKQQASPVGPSAGQQPATSFSLSAAALVRCHKAFCYCIPAPVMDVRRSV